MSVTDICQSHPAPVFIIAEAGVNHNGSIDMARRLVDAALQAGADAVKFQTFKAENLVSRMAPKALYQQKRTSNEESQFDMLKKLELGPEAHRELMGYCQDKGISFLSSPFDLESIDLLNGLGMETFKIPSGEITNLPYLMRIGCLKKKVILSTGMADLHEIGKALEVLRAAGMRRKDVTVLHCNTEYPTPVEHVNLLAMVSMKKAFRVSVGYSDHTPGIEIPVAAVALGASVIEKHITLDKTMEGPDHAASLEPEEFGRMVTAIRHVEAAMGDGIKRPSPSELQNRGLVRKSIVAARPIKQNDLLTSNNITVKRPGTGISPLEMDRVIGCKAKRDFNPDDLIEL